ncbi:MAG: hypothetical protein HUJ76_02915 [Parasporobacterium sp.]|nr:hypothetical protein [Parasporobacterium sp.]
MLFVTTVSFLTAFIIVFALGKIYQWKLAKKARKGTLTKEEWKDYNGPSDF